MPITTLKIPRDGKETILVFQTDEHIRSEADEHANHLCVKMFTSTEELQPIDTPTYEYFNQSEEDFHKTIRRGAIEENHLVTALSTDPEWTPEGY
tara:strand:- start:508 stop:792 length:285 start_codon:yes stop_codon:yes gene_type:complete